MEPRILTKEAMDIVGVELDGAGRRPYLILNLWVSLCAKMQRVRNPVDLHTLYGIWHTRPGTPVHSYLVGVRVAGVEEVPEGMVALNVAAGCYAMLVHQGNVADIDVAYGAINDWLRETGVAHREGAVVEAYDTNQPLDDSYVVMIYQPVE